MTKCITSSFSPGNKTQISKKNKGRLQVHVPATFNCNIHVSTYIIHIYIYVYIKYSYVFINISDSNGRSPWMIILDDVSFRPFRVKLWNLTKKQRMELSASWRLRGGPFFSEENLEKPEIHSNLLPWMTTREVPGDNRATNLPNCLSENAIENGEVGWMLV